MTTAETIAARTGRLGQIAKWSAIVTGAFLALVVATAIVAPPLTRERTDRWGATDAELEAPLPGDEFVVEPTGVSTKAITIDAPADIVYRLLVQMGYKRGGWYGWDWFYDLTGSSGFVGGSHATSIVPELQTLEEGDAIAINKQISYEVVELNPTNGGKPGWMLLERAMGQGGQPQDVSEPGTDAVLQSWAWYVYPVSSDQTRLVMRTRSGGASQGAFLDWLYDNPLDLGSAVFGYKTLNGIKETAEAIHAEGTP